MPKFDEHDAALMTVLDAGRDRARETLDHLARQHRLGVWHGHPPTSFPELVEPVSVAIMAHPAFNHAPARAFGPKQVMLHPLYLAAGAIKTADSQGSAAAVAWLHRLLAIAGPTAIRFVAEIYGLKVDQPTRLSNDVTLVPLDQLPPSNNAAAVQAQFGIRLGPHIPRMQQAIGAYFERDGYYAQPTLTGSLRHDELDATISAFTLAGNMAPVIGITWAEFVDPDLAHAEHGSMWSGPRVEGDIPHIGEVVDADALSWVERYLALPDQVRARLSVAIGRLNLGRRRFTPGDQALEAGICLEALLRDKDDRQEITYKLSLRAALLLEQELEPRRAVSETVKKLYRLRSNTVHGDTGANRAADLKTAKAGLGICARVLRETVRQGKIIDGPELELRGTI